MQDFASAYAGDGADDNPADMVLTAATGGLRFDDILAEHEAAFAAAEAEADRLPTMNEVYRNTVVAVGDVPYSFVESMGDAIIAVDLETDPCAFDEDRYWERTTPRIVTLHNTETLETVVVRLLEGQDPVRLRFMFDKPDGYFLFHHAMFDLRFLAHHFSAYPANVLCTKVLAKVVGTECKQSLNVLLKEYLGLDIPKGQALSDWTGALTDDQVAYCGADVAYLSPLYDALLDSNRGAFDVARRAMAALPNRVDQEVNQGMADLFGY